MNNTLEHEGLSDWLQAAVSNKHIWSRRNCVCWRIFELLVGYSWGTLYMRPPVRQAVRVINSTNNLLFSVVIHAASSVFQKQEVYGERRLS